MLAVVVMIGVLAATASPMFIHQMRDRRVARAALHVVDTHRLARARAMGRGAAVMVRWTAAAQGGKGLLEVREATTLGLSGEGKLPSSSCFASNNFADDETSRAVTQVGFGTGQYDLAKLVLLDELGTERPSAEICFTPRGRTFVRYGSEAFAPMTGVAEMAVTNEKTGLVRTVFLPSNGAARMAL